MTMLRVAAAAAGFAAAAASLSPALFKAKERFHRSMRTAKQAIPRSQLPPDLYYNQTLDHFEALNIGWWPQRYWCGRSGRQAETGETPPRTHPHFAASLHAIDSLSAPPFCRINDTFWAGASSGAPIMFYVEGEGAGSPLDVVQGQHVELAANYSALIVALEHRELRGARSRNCVGRMALPGTALSPSPPSSSLVCLCRLPLAAGPLPAQASSARPSPRPTSRRPTCPTSPPPRPWVTSRASSLSSSSPLTT